MKKIAFIIVASCISCVVPSLGQTNYRTVMVSTNGVVQKPANFWAANSNNVNAIMSQGAGGAFSRTSSSLASLLSEAGSGSAALASNSIARMTVAATNSAGNAAVRLISNVNDRTAAGLGTVFALDSHTVWTRLEANPRAATIRVVLGNSVSTSTNVGKYPTSRAIGFEVDSAVTDTLRLRLIAHNGTSGTNGPWVTIGDVFKRYWIGVEQVKASDQVKLFIGVDSLEATNNSSATISGGPTNNATSNGSALEAGIFTTTTNIAEVSFMVFSAFVDVID